jgi:hypothetical protein
MAMQRDNNEGCLSLHSMPSLAVSLACSKGLSRASDAAYNPGVDTEDGEEEQSAKFASFEVASALAAIDVQFTDDGGH